MTQRNIGLMSGTFDPIHNGHIGLALLAKQELDLDEVWLLPERSPRRKTNVTPYEHRFAMCGIAAEEYGWIKVKETKQLAHTVETIQELLQPEVHFCLLLGADVAAHFDTWNHASEIKSMVSVVSFGRNQLAGDFHFDHPASSRSIRMNVDKTHLPDKVLKYIQEHKLYEG